jgi:trimeric autotransporter adhesin
MFSNVCRALALSVIFGTATLVTACGGGSASSPSPAAALTQLEISPLDTSTPAGTGRQYSATAIYGDGTKLDVSGSASWQSSNPAAATISSTGHAQAVQVGSTQITAAFGGKSASTGLTVTNAVPTSLGVTPTNPSLALGTTQPLAAVVTFSDGSTVDVTTLATWASSASRVATVGNGDANGKPGLLTAVAQGSAQITATYSGLSGNTGVTVTPATLKAIQVNPANPAIAKGTTQQFTATGVYTDNSTQDISQNVNWISSDASIGPISSTGLAAGKAVGSVTITAAQGSLNGSTSLTVTAAVLQSIAVSPATASIAKGTTQQFTATGTYTDNSTQDLTQSATWSSSDTTVATISNASASSGLAQAVNPGSVTITAASGGFSGTAKLTVTSATLQSVAVTPATPSIPNGKTQQFKATGTYSDNTTQDITQSVTWASANTGTATISNASGSVGLATGKAVGSTTISATQGGLSGSATLTVTAAVLQSIAVTPATASIAKGTAQQFTATGTYSDGSTQDVTAATTWSSSNTGIATISNASGSNGLAQAVNTGSVTIGATSGGQSATATLTVTAAALKSIAVTPSSPSIPNGTTQQFTATGTYTDSSTQDLTQTVTWASDNANVLEVSNSSGNKGLAAARAQGSANISAAYQGVTGATAATVSAASLSAIQVTPANSKLAAGFSLQYSATGIYSDNSSRDITTSVTWASSNTSAATISNAAGSNGLATATTTPGSSSISATLSGVSGTTVLTVTNATLSTVSVTPSTPSIPLGNSVQMKATGTFSDNTTQDLTTQASWSSSDTSKATVSNSSGSQGAVKSVSQGSSTITASVSNAGTRSAVAGSTTVTVTGATLNGITVSPSTASIAKGTTQPFKATGTYSDNSTQDITGSVSWSSSNTAVASISAAGVATGASVGSATITAASGSVSGTATLSVTAATLKSMAVTPASTTVPAGVQQAFKATGTYSDSSTQDLTTTVTWTSSDTSLATISNASGSQGVASTVKAGQVTITAATGSTTATATLTVSSAVAQSLSITPANSTIGNQSSQQFTAIETYSDGSQKDQTKAVTWKSSDVNTVDISNASGSQGLATAKLQGQVTITATDAAGGVSGSTMLTVGPAQLNRIVVTCKTCGSGSSNVPAGFKAQFKAVGTYSDGSTADLTTSASITWNVLNTAVATVDSSSNKGLVTGVAAGSTTLVAQVGNVQGTATLPVTGETLGSIQVTPANPTIVASNTLQFTATGSFSGGSTLDITLNNSTAWASSFTQAVSINASTGLAQGGNLPGNATISATNGSVSGNTTATHTLR